METISSKNFDNNPTLKETVEPDTDLKNMLIEYVGEKLNPDDQNITVEMLVEVMRATAECLMEDRQKK